MTRTRPGGDPISVNFDEALAAVWPGVAHRIAVVLGARGADAADIDDVLQTTAERALTKRVPFERSDDLFAWAYTVARRALVDVHRRRSWIDPAPLPDTAAADDVERRARGRLALEALAPAVRSLGRAERSALAGSEVVRPGSSEARREAVRRFRARAKLATVVEGILAWVLLVVRRLRRKIVLVPGLTVAAALGLAALLVLPGPDPSSAEGVNPGVTIPTAVAPVVAPVTPIRESGRELGTASPTTSTTHGAPPPSGPVEVGVSGFKVLVGPPAAARAEVLCHADPVLGRHCVDWPASPTLPLPAPGGIPGGR